MARRATLSAGTTHADVQPFDVDLSLTLDEIIIQLDADATGLRRQWLLLHKRWYERCIPAFFGVVIQRTDEEAALRLLEPLEIRS